MNTLMLGTMTGEQAAVIGWGAAACIALAVLLLILEWILDDGGDR